MIASDAPDALEQAIDLLRRGEIVALPTETVYGLAVLPRTGPLERLLAAKRRSPDKGIQLLIDSVAQVSDLTELTPDASLLAAAFWPGGLTIVVRRLEGSALPALVGGSRPTIGLRLPDHPIPRRLARAVGPLAASSANVSGEPDATTAEQVLESLGGEVALIIDDGPVRGGLPSTVVDCSHLNEPPRILRVGAISAAAISAALG